MDVNFRMKFIEDLDSCILANNQLLSNICHELEWTEESLLGENKVQCPIDPNHWVVESSLSSHIEACSWVKNGYLKEEVEKQPPDSDFFYKKAPSVVPITIDKETQANILIENGLIEKKPLDEMPDVPKTVDCSMVDLNLEQRLAIYDHIIKEAKKANISKSVTLEDLMFDFEKKNDQEDKPKSQLEILAEQRDYKRRRQSYRAKNVHITKKSYTEILKELIENQTTMLADMQKLEASEIQNDPDSNKGEKKELELRQGYKSPSTRETSDNGYKHLTRKRDRSPIARDSSYKHESRKRDWSPSERDPHYNDYYHESRKRDRRSISRESSYDGYKHDSRKRDKNSSAKESSCDDYKHASRDRRSRSRSRKKKKHKHDRSRSRSRSHKHKKSHKKHKNSHD